MQGSTVYSHFPFKNKSGGYTFTIATATRFKSAKLLIYIQVSFKKKKDD